MHHFPFIILTQEPKNRYHRNLVSSQQSNQCNLLLHVGASSVRLRRDGLALDALSAGVVAAGVLADVGGARVRGDGSLAGAVALGVAGGVGGAVALLLGLLLLELLGGAGTATRDCVSIIDFGGSVRLMGRRTGSWSGWSFLRRGGVDVLWFVC